MTRTGREPKPKAQDEERLLQRLRAGDEAAFAELVRENSGRLMAVARRMLRSEDEARDALRTPSSRPSAPSAASRARRASPPGCTGS